VTCRLVFTDEGLRALYCECWERGTTDRRKVLYRYEVHVKHHPGGPRRLFAFRVDAEVVAHVLGCTVQVRR
jgi:hypothetical protein